MRDLSAWLAAREREERLFGTPPGAEVAAYTDLDDPDPDPDPAESS